MPHRNIKGEHRAAMLEATIPGRVSGFRQRRFDHPSD